MIPMLDRRAMLAGLTGAALMPPCLGHAALDRLTLFGAPIGVSLPLAHVVDQNALRPVVAGTALHIWRSPDEMRAGVAAGDIEVTTSPAPTAANLYTRGAGMRLAGVLTTGMLYGMTTAEGVSTLADLAGQTVLVPFRGDMPDRVFQLALKAEGMTMADVSVEYVATPLEAARLLLAGRAPAAVLQEPAATMARMRGRANGLAVRRAIDLQARYAAATGGAPDIPMAVLILRDRLIDRMPDLPAQLAAALRDATAWVNNAPASAARLGEDYMGLRKPVLEWAIPHMNLSFRTPQAARAQLEPFYAALSSDSMALLGGRLPDDGFYLDIAAG